MICVCCWRCFLSCSFPCFHQKHMSFNRNNEKIEIFVLFSFHFVSVDFDIRFKLEKKLTVR